MVSRSVLTGLCLLVLAAGCASSTPVTGTEPGTKGTVSATETLMPTTEVVMQTRGVVISSVA
ncbi:MAG: hypothetical protein P8129_11880, partial [Anaerolineae bacterium]